MFHPSRRFSTRRWLIAIAIIAMGLGAYRWAENRRLAIKHKQAIVRFQKVQAFYDEGRVTCDRIIDSSRELMQARLDLSRDPAERIEAIQAHLKRVDLVLEVERNDLSCRRGGRADIAESEQMREEAAMILAQEKGKSEQSGSPEIDCGQSKLIPSIVKSSRRMLR